MLLDGHPLIERVARHTGPPRVMLLATRRAVWQVVECAERDGVDGAAEQLGLARAQVRAALDFYQASPVEVDLDRGLSAHDAACIAG